MISVVIGTRPEVIKMAPVIRAIKALKYPCQVITTGQHDDLLKQALTDLEVKVDVRLNRKLTGEDTMCNFLANLIIKLQHQFTVKRPKAVLAQGDTLTVLATSTVCFMNQIPFGLVEAGLRTYDLMNPFPEEYNRVVASVAAHWLFAATDSAGENLIRESKRCHPCYMSVVGNPVVDSIQWALLKKPAQLQLPGTYNNAPIIVTCHRRESFGVPLWNICQAIANYALAHPEREIWWPVHPNPSVKVPVNKRLCDIKNIKLMAPMGYLQFINAMASAALIVTDSGGISEEVATLGKRALILRTTTERPECLEANCRLVGTDATAIEIAIEETLKLPELPRTINPFGDGRAGSRIASIVVKELTECT